MNGSPRTIERHRTALQRGDLSRAIKRTVALVDAADATSSGAPGDSNAILRELLATDYYRGRALQVKSGDEPIISEAKGEVWFVVKRQHGDDSP